MEIYGKPLYTAFDDVYAKKEDIQKIQEQIKEDVENRLVIIDWLAEHDSNNRNIRKTIKLLSIVQFIMCVILFAGMLYK